MTDETPMTDEPCAHTAGLRIDMNPAPGGGVWYRITSTRPEPITAQVAARVLFAAAAKASEAGDALLPGPPPLPEWYFTFGHGQYHPDGRHLLGWYVRIPASDAQAARAEMVRLFGDRWSCQYTADAAAEFLTFGERELPLPDQPVRIRKASDPEHTYLIWSNEHRGWWRQNRHSYTPVIEWAGMFPEDEARSIVEGAALGGPMTAHDNYGIYRDQPVPNEVLVPVDAHPGGPDCPPAVIASWQTT